MTTAFVTLAGGSAGLGIFAVIQALVPGQFRLDAALARMTGAGMPWPGASFKSRAVHRLARTSRWLPVPDEDLQLLGHDREAWLGFKAAGAVLGLGAPAITSAVLAIAGVRLPFSIPVLASLACGLAAFMAPDLVTRFNAAERREDFRHALTSYLDLVALMRTAGAGANEALEAAASIGQGWAFAQLTEALDQARRAGDAPWAGLASLAAHNGVADLADIADIAGIAGQEGARILDTLMARAESMRARQLADAHARSTARTATMAMPVALMAGGFLVLLMYPMVFKLFAAR